MSRYSYPLDDDTIFNYGFDTPTGGVLFYTHRPTTGRGNGKRWGS